MDTQPLMETTKVFPSFQKAKSLFIIQAIIVLSSVFADVCDPVMQFQKSKNSFLNRDPAFELLSCIGFTEGTW